MKRFFVPILLTLILVIEIFCIKGILVLADIFPLENTDAVFFTLTHNMSGAGSFALSLYLGILRDSVIISLLTILAIVGILSLLKRRTLIYYTRILGVLGVICFVILATTICIKVPIARYYQKWTGTGPNTESTDFYETEYVDPDSVKIEFIEKKNLILIFLESIEYNFQDSLNGGSLQQNLIPEITKYIKQEQSFTPGGTKIAGTGWTMADVVAKTCGIPMMLSPHTTNYPAPQGKFYPGVTCLTDILHDNGYTTVVSKGAQLSFSKMDAFIKAHSIDEGYGLDEYKRMRHIDEHVLNEWGISDSTHYELIKDHISRISISGKPWAVWFVTLNTHTPYGAFDPGCHIPNSASDKELLLSSIHCTSRQLDEFIKWAKAQEWFKNTTIAVMGDHASMNPAHLIGFKDNKEPHYWLNFFINSAASTRNYNRTFSSIDMFPTILESVGAKIPGHTLGLGRSLYSLSPTLLEQYDLDSLNKMFEKSSSKYGKFIHVDKKSPNR